MEPPLPRAEKGDRVELYVRSLAPTTGRERQETVIRRLRDLVEAGAVDGFELVVTGQCICPDSAAAETDIGRFLLERLRTFEEWAEEEGAALDPCYRRRDETPVYTGERYTGISVPNLAMAEFSDGDLSFLTPCRVDGRRVTVEERLEAISDAGSGADERPPRSGIPNGG